MSAWHMALHFVSGLIMQMQSHASTGGCECFALVDAVFSRMMMQRRASAGGCECLTCANGAHCLSMSSIFQSSLVVPFEIACMFTIAIVLKPCQ